MMTYRQYFSLFILAILMAAAAFGMGRWAESLNPDGIIPHTPVAQETAADSTASIDSSSAAIQATPETTNSNTAENTEVRSAFTFGASMGLLAAGLLYCVIAAGLLLRQRSQGLAVNRFIVSVASLAVAGFALSYLIDDYFY